MQAQIDTLNEQARKLWSQKPTMQQATQYATMYKLPQAPNSTSATHKPKST